VQAHERSYLDGEGFMTVRHVVVRGTNSEIGRRLGLNGGAGSTGRAERVLDESLRGTGAAVIRTRSSWLWRPNDERRTNESNRAVALDLAKQLGLETGKTVLAGRVPTQ
jgi:hypothetical protein